MLLCSGDKHGGLSREGSDRVAVLKATGLVRSYTLECYYNTGQMVNVCSGDKHGGLSREGDKHGGLSREGPGRVAVLKATGLVRSYTLECNYNTGQMVNVVVFQGQARGLSREGDKHGGLSREGPGRVAVLKATGLVRSYTLECNYNTGQMVNVLPPTQRDTLDRRSSTLLVPPKYNPQVYEEVGKGLCYSILDLTGANPNSRLGNSEFRTLCGVREWLRKYVSVSDPGPHPKPHNQGSESLAYTLTLDDNNPDNADSLSSSNNLSNFTQVRFGIRLTPIVRCETYFTPRSKENTV
ncbi:cytosolic carboxypeptidase-like protein 5 [Homalodisca vitripennis]|uniref:cytosolic carboxypeptidase-like protein 5 n=1 Tax=Homalodisca vitripennis TaxID=197043 RepID=UPI001EEC66C6|nr:cytosolic carboxypeptidase-like protein 5 [Homalodisca vitripennis]